MKPAHYRTPARTPINRLKISNMPCKDSVQVYCRIRPMESLTEMSCIKPTSATKVVITPPESANVRNKEIREYTFSRVFKSDATQKEIFRTVALPLVENLIQGKNGLLFTYGVTGSGKTYTMTGEPQDSGIIPRCLDVIFNTISNYQTKKFVFKPDKFNNFDVQSETDAMLMRQQELQVGPIPKGGKFLKYRKVDSDGNSIPTVVLERSESQIVKIEPDNAYSVFVTYVEIYKNNICDLLDDDDARSKQYKIIREDGNKNMYVYATTEIEVKSTEEAFEIFQRGQRRKRVAQTALNAESSRSHSIFTIRLVQAPLDCEGEHVMQNKQLVCVSQLSLVDLAGSERTNRTKNTGNRLREAGNINNSLMTLRLCLDILRENQSQGTSKIVPYRDSKLTLLFKNYFDGEGLVRMIVCVNPRADDFDETIQVMNFAEVSQEVQITKPTAPKLELCFTPGRRQANKEVKNKLEEKSRAEPADLDLVYILDKSFPQLETTDPDNDQIINSLIHYLKQHNDKRHKLSADLLGKQNDFRKRIGSVEQENMNLTVETATLKASNSQQKRRIDVLEEHICKTEKQIDSLLCKLNTANDTIRNLQSEVKKRNLALNKELLDKQKVKYEYNAKIRVEKDKINKELEIKLRQQRERNRNEMKENEDKIRLMKHILVDDNVIDPTMIMPQKKIPESTAKVFSDTECRTPRKGNIAVSNPRCRRSRSVERWIDHRPEALVPLGTVLQPLMQKRRSLTRLASPKEITNGASRYCLVAQEQDTDGELETKLYKGDILPTSGGGAQVIFNDMESLKQTSPKARKRSGPEETNPVVPMEVYPKKPRRIPSK